MALLFFDFKFLLVALISINIKTHLIMKKFLLFAALAAIGFTAAQAQISFGAKAGVNFASLYGKDSDNFEGRTDIHVGVVSNIGINEWLSIQPELVYSGQGFKIDGDGIDESLSYINLPIMLDFRIAEGLSLQGGPQFGLNVGDKITFNGTNINNDEFGDSMNDFDFSSAIGAQYVLPFNVFFQARYTTAFNNLFKEVDGENFEIKNAVLSLSVGYFFN